MQTPTDRKAQTHDRIVEVAARAIRRSGFQGTGVADIMKEAGLTHGGFYAHFVSRDAMLVEAVQRAGRDGDQLLAERIAQRRSEGASPLAALIQSYLHDAHLATTDRGCVVAALGSEIARQAQEVAEAGRERVQNLVEAVRHALPPGSDDEAALIAATLAGTVQLARTLGGRSGKTLLHTVRQQLLARFDSPHRN
jgi:TetR/AcrR family transcriptional regulator, transcriptional repressor for nem operon